jgi:hypothetical protein
MTAVMNAHERRKRRMRKWLGIGSVTMLLTMTLGIIMRSPGIAQPSSERDITLVNIESEGTKIWVPGSVAVKKGNTVKIKAINNVKVDIWRLE